MDYSLRRLGNKVRKLHIESNSVVVIRNNTILSENIDELGKLIEQTGVKDVIVVIADDLNDIASFNEEFMNKHGWFKIDQLRRMIKHNG